MERRGDQAGAAGGGSGAFPPRGPPWRGSGDHLRLRVLSGRVPAHAVAHEGGLSRSRNGCRASRDGVRDRGSGARPSRGAAKVRGVVRPEDPIGAPRRPGARRCARSVPRQCEQTVRRGESVSKPAGRRLELFHRPHGRAVPRRQTRTTAPSHRARRRPRGDRLRHPAPPGRTRSAARPYRGADRPAHARRDRGGVPPHREPGGRRGSAHGCPERRRGTRRDARVRPRGGRRGPDGGARRRLRGASARHAGPRARRQAPDAEGLRAPRPLEADPDYAPLRAIRRRRGRRSHRTAGAVIRGARRVDAEGQDRRRSSGGARGSRDHRRNRQRRGRTCPKLAAAGGGRRSRGPRRARPLGRPRARGVRTDSAPAPSRHARGRLRPSRRHRRPAQPRDIGSTVHLAAPRAAVARHRFVRKDGRQPRRSGGAAGAHRRVRRDVRRPDVPGAAHALVAARAHRRNAAPRDADACSSGARATSRVAAARFRSAEGPRPIGRAIVPRASRVCELSWRSGSARVRRKRAGPRRDRCRGAAARAGTVRLAVPVRVDSRAVGVRRDPVRRRAAVSPCRGADAVLRRGDFPPGRRGPHCLPARAAARAEGPMKEGKRIGPRDARDLAPRERWLVALAVTAVLAAWELAIDRAVNGAVSRALGPLARTLLLDAALWLPLAVFALLAAKVVCRRGVSSKASSAGIAAVAALAFGALLVPVAIVGQKALATGIPTLAGDSVDAVGGAISASAWLCSAIGSSRGAETGIGSAVAASARTALLLEAAAFPAFWAAIALARRGEGSRFLAIAAAAIAAIVVDGTMVAAARAREDDGPSVSAAPGCLAGHPVRSYAVSAIDVDIPLNRWGGHVSGASMYVLDSRLTAGPGPGRAPPPGSGAHGLPRRPPPPPL